MENNTRNKHLNKISSWHKKANNTETNRTM